MRARVIVIEGDDYSETVGQRCIDSGKKYGVIVEKFKAVTKYTVEELMLNMDVHWVWAGVSNDRKRICPNTNLVQFPYTCADLRTKKACSMSHYFLWKQCEHSDEPMLILEHDAIFVRELPNVDFKSIYQINNPVGCTPQGGTWRAQMQLAGEGVRQKTIIHYKDDRPDGLAGNSAYMMQPWAATKAIDLFECVGVWPNDATLCRQLFTDLEEYYPFIVETRQERSTTVC
ncbi:MAG: hypothetical protein DRQ63_12225 [Gammaproteobacteria bacterium]|nr:MAG: hypothetical protein DRQ63_12225 [Gammaproteobacteria bacterium]